MAPDHGPHHVSSGKQVPCFKADGLLKHETMKESLSDIFKRLYGYFSGTELALLIIGNAENRVDRWKQTQLAHHPKSFFLSIVR